MSGKGFKELLAEANGMIESITTEEAAGKLDDPDTVFVDVRESGERAKTGGIPGSVHVPRGFLEFMADPSSPNHKPELSSGKTLVIYCASGGRSALAGKTLKEMGIDKVINLVGGFNGWQQQGGPVAADR